MLISRGITSLIRVSWITMFDCDCVKKMKMMVVFLYLFEKEDGNVEILG